MMVRRERYKTKAGRIEASKGGGGGKKKKNKKKKSVLCVFVLGLARLLALFAAPLFVQSALSPPLFPP